MDDKMSDQIKEHGETIDIISNTIPVYCPKPIEFDKFLQWACREYRVDSEVVVTRAFQETYISAATTISTKKHGQKRKTSKLPSLIQVQDPSSHEDYFSLDLNRGASRVPENIVNVETVYDVNENLVQLKLLKNKVIPRKVMQVIALSIPFQKYLTTITINSGLRMDSLYELSKCLPNSQITELCFDGTFLSKANYCLLLTQSKLKHLSLAKCSINDDVLKTIAEQLIDPCPAARVLSALNLSTNRITDIGAKYIADVLRTNRQLSYLNLAGNMITDEGGVSILDTLQKFPLQSEELIESRTRYVVYLRERNALANALFKELQAAALDKNTTKKKMSKKLKLESQSLHRSETEFDAQVLQERAENLANSRMGVFNEPFSPNNTETQGGVLHCLGNNTLCCLNFAYNNLTYVSLKKLLEVLVAQKFYHRTPRGLIRVVIEGNLMPVDCKEFKEIEQILGSVIKSLRRQSDTAINKKRPLSSRSRETSGRSGK